MTKSNYVSFRLPFPTVQLNKHIRQVTGKRKINRSKWITEAILDKIEKDGGMK